VKGIEIVLSFVGGEGRQRIEGIINTAQSPGTIMQMTTAAPIGGRFTFDVWAPGTGDGTPGAQYILDTDGDEGKLFSDAYQAGKRGFLHQILPGDEVNVRKADIAGTGSATESVAIGDKFYVVDGTGKISKVAVGVLNANAQQKFQSQETLTNIAAETLVWCRVI
jgi:hypothetical protein